MISFEEATQIHELLIQKSTHDEVYSFIIKVATGEHNINSITNWIKFHVDHNEP